VGQKGEGEREKEIARGKKKQDGKRNGEKST